MKTAARAESGLNPRSRRTRSRSRRIPHILVPIDFSPPSLNAIPCALAVARRFSAEVHLLHVVDSTEHASKSLGLPLVSPPELSRPLLKQLQTVAFEFGAADKIHVMKPREGRAYVEICEVARELKTELIVIPTHGYTGFKHVFLGSTTERVVQHSSCPVLVVRQQARDNYKWNGRLRKILVPIDFSECSMKGLAYAMALAREFKSNLVLLNSVHFEYYVASDEYARYDLPLLMQQAEKAAREQMQDLVQNTNWEGLDVETSVEAGHAGQQICERAQDRGVDLIVTSTHGTTGLKHVLIGSTAEYVVQHAYCPVLVVPTRPLAPQK